MGENSYFYSELALNKRVNEQRMGNDNIDRFSYRAEHYDKFRPGYPDELIRFLHQHAAVGRDTVIADMAAGTGIFTEQLARWGNPIFAIEPNPSMRRLAEKRLRKFENCTCREGRAESSGLPDGSVDLIVSAQAFHWFDLEKARSEFERIGRGTPCVAVIWNLRNADSQFEAGYETLIQTYSVDYLQVSQRRMTTAEVLSFFGQTAPDYRVFNHEDFLTHEQLVGRTLSYSYMPEVGAGVWEEVMRRLEALFHDHQRDGRVRLSYKTRLFVGKI